MRTPGPLNQCRYPNTAMCNAPVGDSNPTNHLHFTRAPRERSSSTSPLCLCAPAATAVPRLWPGRVADVSASLRGVRESLRRVLPGPGPLLRLGRQRVLEILPHRQEVGACAPPEQTHGPSFTHGWGWLNLHASLSLHTQSRLAVISAPAV